MLYNKRPRGLKIDSNDKRLMQAWKSGLQSQFFPKQGSLDLFGGQPGDFGGGIWEVLETTLIVLSLTISFLIWQKKDLKKLVFGKGVLSAKKVEKHWANWISCHHS